MDTLWTIKLLGGLRVTAQDEARSGVSITHFRTRRAGVLLARLAFQLGKGPLLRDALAEELWPDSDPIRALARLAVELSALRTQIEPMGIPKGAVIRSDRFTIHLDPARVVTDVGQFEAASDRAAKAKDIAEQTPLLSEAFRQYSGPLLPEMDAHWIEPERERLAERFLYVAHRYTAALLRQKHPDEAEDIAREVVERERRRADAHYLLMRTLLDVGRPDDALRQFHTLEQMLAENGLDDALPAQARRLADEAIASASLTHLAAFAALPAPPSQTPTPIVTTNAALSPPSGTVAVLNTDIVGSTALGRRIGEDAYADVRATHHALLRREFHRAGGYEFKETGDGFWVAFETIQDALKCACACQDALAEPEALALDPPLRARMALHIVQVRPDAARSDYHSLDLHDAARLLSAANGGQVLVSEAAEAILRRHLPDGFQLVDRGVYRLRDAPGPEHLWEACWSGMSASESPAPNAPPAHTPSLPPAFTRFVGRETEIVEIVAALSGSARLVTLTGIGGTGKTRLALEAARAMAPRFAGAVWFVPLTDCSDATRLPDVVCAAMGGPVSDDPSSFLDSQLGAQPSLLILDNLEQLLDCEDGVDTWVQTALERWPLLAVLGTSRQRLGLPAEQEFPVAPLPTPPSAGANLALSELLGIGSVALFEDRARHARPDFRLTERNAQAVMELCSRLEGIPLGLELAAAWARMLTPAEMLAQLPQVRRSRDKNLPERHRSLTAAIEGSYRLLDAEQRQFFRRLAVFRGGWTVEAACMVCDEPDALLLLADLRDHSLVTVADKGDSTRYSLLETLREFADAKLTKDTPGEADATRDRHRDFFASLSAQAEPELKGADQARWLARLAAEHENLRAALTCLNRAGRLQMASQLHRYWMVRGHFAEGRHYLADALNENDETVPPALRIEALIMMGALALSAGDLDAAQDTFLLARGCANAIKSEQDEGRALVNLAIIASHSGDYAAARRDYEASLPLWRRLGLHSTVAVVLSNLGALTLEQNDLDAARGFLEESLQVQADDDLLLRANTLHNLAEIAVLEEDYGTALWRLNECLSLRLQLEDRSAVPNLIFLLADIKTRQGLFDGAVWLYGAGEATCRITEAPPSSLTRSNVDASKARLRDEVGEIAFVAAWHKGNSYNWEQILSQVTQMIAT